MISRAPRARKPYQFFYFIAGIVVAIIGISLSFYSYHQIDSAERAHILDRAETIAKMIPISEIKNLSGTSDDLYSPSYQNLKKVLSDVKGVNSDIRFAYLMGQNASGTLFFYVDSEDASSRDYSPPGQLYQEATPPMYETLEDGVSRSEGPSSDRWGTWISGYASVADNSGIVALVGMDIPAQEYILNTLAYASIPILVSSIIIVIIYFLQYLGQREERYLNTKEELLSIASHEIRTPLLGMRWALDDIWRRNDVQMDEQTKSTVRSVYENTLKVIKEADDLLSLTALKEAGKKTVKKEKVELKEFFEDIKNILSLSAKEHRVSIKIDESISEKSSALFDRKNMHHAFFNLVSNAIKYSKPDTEIVISYMKDKSEDIFKVIDRGRGIKPEDMKKIFGGYFRTSEAEASGEAGTGLGLYLTRKIIESHKGEISVESKIGEGSTFIVKIPRQ